MNAARAAINRLLPRAPFARGVSMLVGGTVGAQALLILVSPLLTRLYTPDDFGLLAVYAALLALFGVIASLRYQLAIPLPEDETAACNLVALCFLLVIGMTALSAVIVFLVGNTIAELLGVPRLAPWLWLLPIGLLFSGAQEALQYFAIRRKAFGTVARTNMQRSFASVTLQLVSFKLGAFGLLLAQAAGQATGTAALGRLFFRRATLQRVTWSGVKEQALRYRRFPLYSTWSSLINTAGIQLPPMLFAALFGPAIAGFYSLANRILSLPMSVIGSAIGQVFFSEAVQSHREGHLGPLVAQLHARLAHLGLPPFMLLAVVGPDLFALVFGENWREAGEYARWLVPSLYFSFIASPLSTVTAVIERQKISLIFQGILFSSRLLALYAGASIGSIVAAVACYSLAGTLSWMGFLFWLGRVTVCPLSAVILPTLTAGMIALGCILPIALTSLLPQVSQGNWLLALILSTGLVFTRIAHLLKTVYNSASPPHLSNAC